MILKFIVYLIICTLIWGGIFSIIMWSYNPADWSWFARLLCLLFISFSTFKSLDL